MSFIRSFNKNILSTVEFASNVVNKVGFVKNNIILFLFANNIKSLVKANNKSGEKGFKELENDIRSSHEEKIKTNLEFCNLVSGWLRKELDGLHYITEETRETILKQVKFMNKDDLQKVIFAADKLSLTFEEIKGILENEDCLNKIDRGDLTNFIKHWINRSYSFEKDIPFLIKNYPEKLCGNGLQFFVAALITGQTSNIELLSDEEKIDNALAIVKQFNFSNKNSTYCLKRFFHYCEEKESVLYCYEKVLDEHKCRLSLEDLSLFVERMVGKISCSGKKRQKTMEKLLEVLKRHPSKMEKESLQKLLSSLKIDAFDKSYHKVEREIEKFVFENYTKDQIYTISDKIHWDYVSPAIKAVVGSIVVIASTTLASHGGFFASVSNVEAFAK